MFWEVGTAFQFPWPARPMKGLNTCSLDYSLTCVNAGHAMPDVHAMPGESKCLRMEFITQEGKCLHLPMRDAADKCDSLIPLSPQSKHSTHHFSSFRINFWALFFPWEIQQRSIPPYKGWTAVVSRLMYHTHSTLDNSVAVRHHHLQAY